ncbi:methyltransferase family protein [Silvimonas amylolytica]|uniref:Protein-S-isoprenylcysteine O-methyltransferase Ste14 n=1 Tax=Silvimonas amylolytica TaxID=449663 RepID=A0ABQ2PIX5_9NEIS|nr:methyltransferase [Silvimonas amylolytica]GGP24929.1 hypothetical protein GCM10010971_07480 [Silvimonas amylolytica]
MVEHILAWHGLGWLFWAVWWTFIAGGIHQAQPLQPPLSRLLQVLLIFVGFVLLNQYDPSEYAWEQILSLLLLVGGLAGMVQSRRVLGAAFTDRSGQLDPGPLATCGIYRRVRHPLCSFFVLAFCGTALAHGWQALWTTIPVLAAFVWKARQEENTLQARFGTRWTDYSNHTARMVPGIW